MNYSFYKALALAGVCYTSMSLLASQDFQLRDSLFPAEVYSNQISPAYIYSWPYVITAPGYYVFVTDIYMDTTSNNQVGVTIAPGVSDVIIDLNTYRITQHAPVTSTGSYGIYVSPGCHNVVIRNGTVSALNGVGIYVDSQTTNINIYNFDISALQGTGIITNGTNGFYCSDLCVDTVTSTGSSNATGVLCNNSNTIIMNNCNISNTIASSANSYGLSINNSTALQINGCIVDNIQSGGMNAYGYLFNNCSGSVLNNCAALSIVSTFTGTNSSLLSSLLTTLTSIVNVQNLVGLNLTTVASVGPIGLAAGFSFNNSSGSTIKNSRAMKVVANGGIAYGMVSNNGADNHFTNNEIIGNLGGVNADGCAFLGTEKRSVVSQSKISGNIGATGLGVGVYVSNLATFILINNNIIVNHNSSVNGIGIYDGLGALTANRFFTNFLTNNTVALSFTSSNAPIFVGPTSSTPATYQNTVL